MPGGILSVREISVCKVDKTPALSDLTGKYRKRDKNQIYKHNTIRNTLKTTSVWVVKEGLVKETASL